MAADSVARIRTADITPARRDSRVQWRFNEMSDPRRPEGRVPDVEHHGISVRHGLKHNSRRPERYRRN